MPIRSFNYTGRRRITRDEVTLRLSQSSDKTGVFDADIQLNTRHALPMDAVVCVEAYRGASASWMRFPYGTVGAIKPPLDRRLTEFDGIDGILFRVKVTSPGEKQGLILAEADKLSVRQPDEEEHLRQSILPVRSDKNLEKRVWRLAFEHKGPVLLVNSALGEKWDIVRDQAFMTLVLPEVMEAILVRILLVEQYRDDDDQVDETGGWYSQWLRFSQSIPGTTEPPEISDKDAVEEWIGQVVGAFSRKQKILDRYEGYQSRGDK